VKVVSTIKIWVSRSFPFLKKNAWRVSLFKTDNLAYEYAFGLLSKETV